MSEVIAPQAKRITTPSWRDSRLITGLVLVLLSTALGGWAMARADHTVPIYVASTTLVPGQTLTGDDLRRVDVQLGDGSATYLSAASPLPPDLHILRAANPGELIPVGATGSARDVTTRVVAVPVDATAASGLTRGMAVDVFVNRPSGLTSAGKTALAGPELVLVGVTVAAVPESSTMLGASFERSTVHLVIAQDKVKSLVADMDLEARITLVPTPTTGGSGP